VNAGPREPSEASAFQEIRVKKFLDVLALLALGTAVLHGLDAAARRRSARTRSAAARRSAAEARPVQGALLRSAAPGDDERLRERLRSRLARVLVRPRAVDVEVRGGEVRLCGRVRAHEVDRLTSLVWSTPGVEGIENRLAIER